MKEKIKVLFLATANNIHTVKWVNSLCEEFEVHLAYCKGHGEDINKIDKRIVLHELKFKAPLGYYLNAYQLRKLFNNISADLINVHYASGYGTLVRIARIKPVLLSLWGSDVYDFPNESKIKKKILTKNVNYADKIASTSSVMAEELKRQVQNINKDIYITPFGVDTEKFKKKPNRNKEKETFNIGNIKTLEKKYGIEFNILAIRKLIDKLNSQGDTQRAKSIRMYIYGDGSQKESLENLIKDNQLENVVFLKGRIPNDEVPNALNELDVFCPTSNNESFGVAVVEAMACEVPVVATDADGFKEVIEDNKTGYLVERKNVEQIAEALEKVLFLTTEEREKMGALGRKKVLEKYDWIKNVEKMKEIYNHIVAENKEEK